MQCSKKGGSKADLGQGKEQGRDVGGAETRLAAQV